MTEELITALGAIEGLRVAAKTSTFHLKGKDLEIRTIGERLNVETLLEGSVRKAGTRLRVTAQLVNVSDGYHLWSERYDRQLDDVFAVQDQIAHAIVERLKVKLVGPKEAPLVKRASSNLEAYQLYLKGRYYFARRYQGGLERAVDCFAQAVGLDPDLAPALAGLADGYSVEGFWGLSLPRVLLPKAREAAERAVALDDSLADAHLALAMVHLFLDWNWEVMEREFTRALTLDPNAPLAHAYYGLSLAATERTGDAEREAEQAMRLDPLSALVFFLAAGTHNTLGQWGRAIDIGQQVLSLDPGFLPAIWILGLALSDAGRHEEAIEAAERGVRLTGRVPFFVGALGRAFARAGRRDAAREVLGELLERSECECVSPWWVALIYDGLGEAAEGIEVLERGIPDWGAAYVYPSAGRTVSTLQRHPRFWEMLKGLGYTSPRASPPAPATAGG